MEQLIPNAADSQGGSESLIFDQLTKAFYAELARNEDMQLNFKPHHASLYMWICELRSQIQYRQPGQEVMDLPVRHSMEMASIGSSHTFKKCLDDLEKWGIVEVVSKTKGLSTKIRLAATYLQRHQRPA